MFAAYASNITYAEIDLEIVSTRVQHIYQGRPNECKWFFSPKEENVTLIGYTFVNEL